MFFPSLGSPNINFPLLLQTKINGTSDDSTSFAQAKAGTIPYLGKPHHKHWPYEDQAGDSGGTTASKKHLQKEL